MKKILIPLILAVLLGLVIGFVLYVRYERSSALIVAKAQLRKGQWQKALETVTPVYERNKRDLEVALIVAQAQRELGEIDAALLTLTPFIPPAGRDPRALELAGWVQLDAGDTQSALEQFSALGETPEYNPQSLIGTAAAKLVQSGGYSERLLSEARHFLNLAIAKNPGIGLAHLVLGQVSLAERNLAEAESAAEQAIRLMENPARAYLLRGEVRLAKRQFDRAESDFREALDLGAPAPAVARQRALLDYHQGFIERAASSLQEIAEQNTPEGLQSRLNLAAICALMGEPTRVTGLLSPIKDKVESPILLLQLYEAYLVAGLREEAELTLRELIRESPVFVGGLLEEAIRKSAAGESWTGPPFAGSLSEGAPENVWVAFFQQTASLLEGNPIRALEISEVVLRQSAPPPLAFLNTAVAALLLGRPHEARQTLSRVNVRLAGDPRYTRVSVLAEQHAGHLRQALAHVSGDNTAEDLWLRVQLLLRAYRFEEAEEALKQSNPLPSNRYLLLKSALAALQGRYSEAEILLNRIDSTQANLDRTLSDWCDLIRACCAAMSGDRNRAGELLYRLTRVDSPIYDPAKALALRIGIPAQAGGAETPAAAEGTPFYLYEIASRLEQSGQPEEAILRYRSIVEKNPDFVPALDRLAYLFRLRGNLDVAQGYYRDMLELGSNRSVVQRNLACLAWETGDTVSAERYFTEAEESSTDRSDLNTEYALLLLRKGEIKKVRNLLGPFREDAGPSILALYGYVAEMEQDWSRAALLLEQAAKLCPDDAWIWMNHGVTMVHLGKYTEAEESFQKTLRIEPTSADGHRLLGQLYADQGLYQAAHRSLSTSLRYQPDQPDVRAMIERIAGWIGFSGA